MNSAVKVKLVLLVICLATGLSAYPQYLNKAKKHFDRFEYSRAIPLYKKALSDKDENVRIQAIVGLADSYRMINNINEAEVWYAKAIALPDIKPVSYFYLGKALRMMGRYDEAEKVFQEYAEKVPEDKRAQLLLEYCRKIKRWQKLPPSAEVKNFTSLNTPYTEFGVAYYKDGIVFTTDRDVDLMNPGKNYQWTNYAYLDLYYAAPVYPNDFWSGMRKPTVMPAPFNQKYHDGRASFTADYRKMFLTRTLKSSRKKDTSSYRTDLLKIFIADLSKDKIVRIIPFPYNSGSYSVGHPSVSADGKMLIFSSNAPGGYGQSDLYVSRFVGDKWTEPENLGSTVNGFGKEVFPFLANDSTLFYSSDSFLGYGGLDIYETNRVNGEWTKPRNLKAPINSSYDDFSIVFDHSAKSGFFSSNRPGGAGADDIYAFRSYVKDTLSVVPESGPENRHHKLMVTGIVKDRQSLLPIGDATVFLLNTGNSIVEILKTDSTGTFKTEAYSGAFYIAKAMKTGYFYDCTSLRISAEQKSGVVPLPKPLLLAKYTLNQVFKVKNIYYDLDKWNIRDDSKPALDSLAGILKNHPIRVELGSHTDSRASFEYNFELSQKRAESAIRYLILKGIDPNRLTAKGYGESRLVNRCKDGVRCSEAEHQANRRTEFKIIGVIAPVKGQYFDLSIFKSGDKISLNLFDPDFFKGCLEKSGQDAGM